MNENIDLTKILKDCPNGWEFYSSIYGDVIFKGIENDSEDPVKFHFVDIDNLEKYGSVTEQGFFAPYFKGECTFFPSRDQRDWSKFTAPWYKKERFDPKTLHTFDRVLVRLTRDCIWNATFFSHYDKEVNWGCYPCVTTSCKSYDKCIPYNEETKHLIGTTEEAPEYYRYWEE